MNFNFSVTKKLGSARLSELTTPHGIIAGPFFQFVATQAGIRGQVFSEDLERLGAQVVLANTYHMHLRPGEDVVAEAGGLHGFMQWGGPVTTDSGGYQVFSLGNNVRLDPDGVTFRSSIDGASHRLTPESAMQIQAALGADIVMQLDVCTDFRATHDEVKKAVEQTFEWAKRCKAEHERIGSPQALYGIMQGGVYPDLREKAAEGLRELGFFGYSIGGEMRDAEGSAIEGGVTGLSSLLPDDAPRYVMGSGAPEDIVTLVRSGFDQFDCVLPVRHARHGKLYRNLNKEKLRKYLLDPERPVVASEFYETLDIKKTMNARDWSVLSPGNPAIGKPYSVGYVHHLMRTEMPNGFRLAVLNNMWFYVELMRALREVIEEEGEKVLQGSSGLPAN